MLKAASDAADLIDDRVVLVELADGFVESLEQCIECFACWRRPNFDHPCRLNFDQGREAVDMTAICG